MNIQKTNENNKILFNSFRDLDRKLIIVTSKNEIFNNYGISELKNPFIGYFFIDTEEGVCIRIIGNKENPKLIKQLIKEKNIVINSKEFNNLEFNNFKEQIELYNLKEQMDKYYNNSEILELRNIKEIDSLRGIYFPDDVLLTIELEDGKYEYIWGKLDGYIAEVNKYIVYLLESSKFNKLIKEGNFAVCEHIKINNVEELIIKGILEKNKE